MVLHILKFETAEELVSHVAEMPNLAVSIVSTPKTVYLRVNNVDGETSTPCLTMDVDAITPEDFVAELAKQVLINCMFEDEIPQGQEEADDDAFV